jgi:hypothetical protein
MWWLLGRNFDQEATTSIGRFPAEQRATAIQPRPAVLVESRDIAAT